MKEVKINAIKLKFNNIAMIKVGQLVPQPNIEINCVRHKK